MITNQQQKYAPVASIACVPNLQNFWHRDFFQGVVGMLDPSRSWVAKWQKQVSAAKDFTNWAPAAASKTRNITHTFFSLTTSFLCVWFVHAQPHFRAGLYALEIYEDLPTDFKNYAERGACVYMLFVCCNNSDGVVLHYVARCDTMLLL